MTDTTSFARASTSKHEHRILILAPFGRDASAAEQVFKRAGLTSTIAPSSQDLIRELGRGVGVMVIASEALDPLTIQAITAALTEQPTWSEIPIVILTPNIAYRKKSLPGVRALGPTGNVTFVPRPVSVEHLLGTVRFALRSRQRQYDMRQLLEQLDRHSRDLKRSNTELERFAYIAAHDMKEPIRMIVGHLGILSIKYAEPLGKQGLKYIETATDGAIRMGAMLEALLKYALVGASTVTPTMVSLASVINGALSNLASSIEANHGSVEVPEQDLTVSGDASLLTQLFQNLIGNALKFHADGVVPRVQITWDSKNTGWSCAISDNGIGIPHEATERIFQIFGRQRSVVEYEGSGIGLATCRRIMELHGGTISVDSTPGKGSTFHVAAPANCVSLPAQVPEQRPAHILMIDDNPHDILLFEEACSAIPLHVRLTTANDGIQARSVLAKLAETEDTPDLITLDLNMPLADGFSVLEYMRERALLPGVPLIVLTSSTVGRDRDRAIALGAQVFVSKPGTFEELVTLINSWSPFLNVRGV